MKKAYIRLSVEDKEREDLSPENQIKTIERVFNIKIEQVYSDIGHTGTDDKRPDYKRLHKELNANDEIYIKDLSRYARNIVIQETYYEKILKNNCKLLSASEDVTNDFMRLVIGVINHIYALDISRKVKSTFKNKVNDNQPLGKAPIGYIKIKNKLVVDTVNSVVVRNIFIDFSRGMDFIKLKQKYGMKKRNIIYILKNKTYIGILKSNDVEYQGKHIPIINDKLFNKAQERLKEDDS